MSILPLLIVLRTSFLKLSVVFALLRNALGIQQIPPNIALYGLGLVLTMFIMAPVGLAIQDHLAVHPVDMAMGLINRSAQQLNVFFLAMPIKSAFALLMMIICFSFAFTALLDRSTSFSQLTQQLLEVFSE